MQDHALRVGEHLVLGGHIRLTVLAIQGGEVVLGITAPEPVEVACPEAGHHTPSCTQGALLTARKPTVGA
jgi:sRNA-binding carbon storage regulator CsrA